MYQLLDFKLAPVDEFDFRMDDGIERVALACSHALAASTGDSVLHLPETQHLVVAVVHSQRVAWSGELHGSQNFIVAGELDTADSLAGVGEDGNLFNSKVDDPRAFGGDEHSFGIVRVQIGIDDSVALPQPGILAPSFG